VSHLKLVPFIEIPLSNNFLVKERLLQLTKTYTLLTVI